MKLELCIYLAVFLSQLQLGLSQADNLTLPLTQTMQVIEGDNNTCPPDDIYQSAQDQTAPKIAESLRKIGSIVEPCHGKRYGKVHHCPAKSCSDIIKQNPVYPLSGYYWLNTSNGTTARVYCYMSTRCPCSTATGFTRIAFVNMTNRREICPGEFKTISTPRRVCGRQSTSSAGCNSAMFNVLGLEYQHVCGRIIGWQIGHPDAFYGGTQQQQGIDGHYIDGISVTYGQSPRKHVWSFATTRSEAETNSAIICPCSHTDVSGATVPSFVGNDYFCESGITGSSYSGRFYTNSDPLWDGKGCESITTTCCTHNNPPWFCKQLPAPTTEDIEVRICDQSGTNYDDTPFELIELYIT